MEDLYYEMLFAIEYGEPIWEIIIPSILLPLIAIYLSTKIKIKKPKLPPIQEVYWFLNKKMTGSDKIGNYGKDGPFMVNKSKYLNGDYNHLSININWWLKRTALITFIISMLKYIL